MFGHFCVWVPCRLSKKRKKGKDADYRMLDFKQQEAQDYGDEDVDLPF